MSLHTLVVSLSNHESDVRLALRQAQDERCTEASNHRAHRHTPPVDSDATVRRMPSASGVMVYPNSRMVPVLSSDQSWRKISTAPRVMSGLPPMNLARSCSI